MSSVEREIGKRIRMYRRQSGLSQAEVGRRLAKPRSHAAVSDIERGKTRMTVALLREMALVLSVQPDHLWPRATPLGYSVIESQNPADAAGVRGADGAGGGW